MPNLYYWFILCRVGNNSIYAQEVYDYMKEAHKQRCCAVKPFLNLFVPNEKFSSAHLLTFTNVLEHLRLKIASNRLKYFASFSGEMKRTLSRLSVDKWRKGTPPYPASHALLPPPPPASPKGGVMGRWDRPKGSIKFTAPQLVGHSGNSRFMKILKFQVGLIHW